MRSESEVAAMNCPVCRVPLSMSDRQGIEIDYCPQCRGVWLDRGELDKIIERSAPAEAAPAAQAPVQPAPVQQPPMQQSGGYNTPGYGQGHPSQGYPSHGYGHGKPYYKKKKHWLEEIFD